MSHYTRPVKQDIDLVIAYPNDDAVIHKAGCSHTKHKAVREAMPTEYDAEGIYEDYYQVAPCAADGKGFICTAGGCIICPDSFYPKG